jgi:hypothetical protein
VPEDPMIPIVENVVNMVVEIPKGYDSFSNTYNQKKKN